MPETAQVDPPIAVAVSEGQLEPVEDCTDHPDGEVCSVEFLARRVEGQCQARRCVANGACVRSCGVASGSEVAAVLQAWEQEGQSWFDRCDEPWQDMEITNPLCHKEVVEKWMERVEDAAVNANYCMSDCLLGKEPPPRPTHPYLVKCEQDSECAREDECATHTCYHRVCSKARRRDGESCTLPGSGAQQGICLASACVPGDKVARKCGTALGRRLTGTLWDKVVETHNKTCEEESVFAQDSCLERKRNRLQRLRKDLENALMNCLLGYHDDAGDWYSPSHPWTVGGQPVPSFDEGKEAAE